MRAAIVGYGRMGREVEAALAARGHHTALRIDPALRSGATEQTAQSLDPEALAGVDVAIEFSLAPAVVANVGCYSRAGIPAVVGTTGWLADVERVRAEVEGGGIGLVHGSNFSVGAHLFFRLGRYAASLVRELDEYDLLIHEIHHKDKRDSPSGTALTLAGLVTAACPRKSRIETGRLDRAPSPEELHVSSSRGGAVPGTHTLYLDSAADTVEIRHQARNRVGFALGAVRAAEWIIGRTGLYTVEQFMDDLLSE